MRTAADIFTCVSHPFLVFEELTVVETEPISMTLAFPESIRQEEEN